ncbi:unnamed protein product [Choristocarpus tenellus]
MSDPQSSTPVAFCAKDSANDSMIEGEKSQLLRSSVRGVISPRSMMLSSGENHIMRMPDFDTFMHQQENLQSLLVDIHDDPDGFIFHVKVGNCPTSIIPLLN